MPRALCLIVLLSLFGCASEPPPVQVTAVHVQILASAQLNPTAEGQPAPLRVKLYQLKGTATFERADFFALFEQGPATLGADLLGEQELLVRPGESITVAQEVEEGSTHLAVLAGFRDLDHAVWRQLTPLQAQQENPLIVTFAARSIVISPRSAAQ